MSLRGCTVRGGAGGGGGGMIEVVDVVITMYHI